MKRVVVTDQAFGGVDRERATVTGLGADFAEHDCRDEQQTLAAVRGADVALVNLAPVTGRVLAVMAPGATVVRYGIGYDNVDVEAARHLGVAVANVPDYGGDTVADHAVASLLCLLRRLPAFDRTVRDRGWCRATEIGPLQRFADTTVGLIGIGGVGRVVAARLSALGLQVLAHDPYAGDPDGDGPQLVALPELLARADAISLHCPSTPATERLIGPDAFAVMRPGTVLVNTSRGALVDTGALVDAIASGTIAAAALDVFDTEPLPPDSVLRDRPEILLTPHAAFYSLGSLAALQRLAADEVARALQGRPLRCRVA
ncbi:C-terminal binding protein [Kineococcus sp. TBRC 1896]|uniref:C-terminal binding protein n=1 Tax=Kineococcus mangrovi TaxID=1660183 RepID=A0ABV4I759_9ACTN